MSQKRKIISNEENFVSKYAKMCETGPSPFVVNLIEKLDFDISDLTEQSSFSTPCQSFEDMLEVSQNPKKAGLRISKIHQNMANVENIMLAHTDKGVNSPWRPAQQHQSVRRYSNNLADVCRTECRICNKEVPLSKMRYHTSRKHGMPITTYKEMYGNHKQQMVLEMYHKCGICGMDVHLDSDDIKNHLFRHTISQKDYNAKYLMKAKTGKAKDNRIKIVASRPVSILDTLSELEDIIDSY